MVTAQSQAAYEIETSKPLDPASTGATIFGDGDTSYIKAFDKDLGSSFNAIDSKKSNCRVGLDFGAGSRAQLQRIRFYPRGDILTGRDRMTNGRFEGSNDGTSYSVISVISTVPTPGWNNIDLGKEFIFLKYSDFEISYQWKL